MRYALMLVLPMLVLTVGGCATEWSKGEGTLFESHTYIGKAPMNHRVAAGMPFSKGGNDPALALLKHEPVNPLICGHCKNVYSANNTNEHCICDTCGKFHKQGVVKCVKCKTCGHVHKEDEPHKSKARDY